MGKKSKKWQRSDGMVYSTNPEEYDREVSEDSDDQPSLPPQFQKLYVSLDRKQRGGKSVTLVEGFQGSDLELADLGKTLKQHCGVGGAVKDGLILIQGDQRKKTLAYLENQRYQVKSKGGR